MRHKVEWTPTPDGKEVGTFRTQRAGVDRRRLDARARRLPPPGQQAHVPRVDAHGHRGRDGDHCSSPTARVHTASAWWAGLADARVARRADAHGHDAHAGYGAPGIPWAPATRRRSGTGRATTPRDANACPGGAQRLQGGQAGLCTACARVYAAAWARARGWMWRRSRPSASTRPSRPGYDVRVTRKGGSYTLRLAFALGHGSRTPSRVRAIGTPARTSTT